MAQAVDVFRHHDRVVDEQADADHQPDQCEDVQRFAREVHDRQTKDQADRDRKRDDHRQAHAAHEEEQNDAGQRAAEQTALDQRAEAFVDDLALIEERFQLEPGEARVDLELLDEAVEPPGDFARIDLGFLDHLNGYRGSAVEPRAILLVGLVVGDLGHVFQPGRQADEPVFQLLDRTVAGHRAQQQFLRAGDDRAAGHREVVRAQVLGHLVDVQTRRVGLLAIDLDEDFLFLEAEHLDRRHAVEAFDGDDHVVLDQIPRIFQIRIDGDADHEHGEAGGTALADEDAIDVRRKPDPGALDAIAHLAVGHRHVAVLLEADEHLRHARQAHAGDLVDPPDGAQFRLDGDRDLVQHFTRRRVLPGYLDEQH